MPMVRIVLLAMLFSPISAAWASQPRIQAAARVVTDLSIKTSDGVRLHLRTAGKGPSCLFLHGGPGQGSLSFEAMGGSALESFARMIYLDQRGSGKSANARNYHLGRMLLDIEEVRAALGLEHMCIIAHSFGGILAAEYARQYPQHVSALIMLNAATYFHSPYNARMHIELAARLTGKASGLTGDGTVSLETAEDDAMQHLADAGLIYRLLSDDKGTQAKMREIDSSYQRTVDFGMSVVKNHEAFREYYADHSYATAKVTTPVLVLTGDRDYAVGPDQYLTFQFPHQKIVHIDGGHLMYYDRNIEVVREMHRFLSDVYASSSGRSESPLAP